MRLSNDNANKANIPVLVLQEMINNIERGDEFALQALQAAWDMHELELLPSDALRQRGKMWACFTHYVDSSPCS